MIYRQIECSLREIVSSLHPGMPVEAILVRPCPDPKFGDYQVTTLMSLAKERRMNPRQFATDVLSRLDVAKLGVSAEVAGGGFLNFRLTPGARGEALREAASGKHLFYATALVSKTYVVDFSSPNVAKPMHVGHIRSTILGDCIGRVLRLLGHRVITDNHIGDWGTQFGKLILGWKKYLDAQAIVSDPISEMERLYKKVNAECDTDAASYEQAKLELAKLQNGDEENLVIWKKMIALSQTQFETIYSRLGVKFDCTLGESFYNPQLKPLVNDFLAKGIGRESEGAIKVFFEDIAELKDHPAVIQKNDGAATYTTTDLATIAYRISTWKPDEIVYVTDGRQQLHFKEVFTAFSRWQTECKIRLSHVWFGSILGPDGKPFKTRAGDTVKLSDLLDEAEDRALKAVLEKNPDLPEDARKEIARVVGIGSVKYADMLPNRQSDYVFDWDKMLAFNGNTAVYLLYAYTRVRSIFRKSGLAGADGSLNIPVPEQFAISSPEEIKLAGHLFNFGLVIEAVANEYRPNFLCNYLYELAGYFAGFYEACPVLKAEGETRVVRLWLCELTARVLKQGLNILGIETTDRM